MNGNGYPADSRDKDKLSHLLSTYDTFRYTDQSWILSKILANDGKMQIKFHEKK